MYNISTKFVVRTECNHYLAIWKASDIIFQVAVKRIQATKECGAKVISSFMQEISVFTVFFKALLLFKL